MELVLKFDMSNPDDIIKYKLLYHGEDFYFVLLDLDKDLREIIKYNTKKYDENYIRALEYVRKKIREELNDYDCSLNMVP